MYMIIIYIQDLLVFMANKLPSQVPTLNKYALYIYNSVYVAFNSLKPPDLYTSPSLDRYISCNPALIQFT